MEHASFLQVKEGREHWRKRQQDGFSKLSQMFEQLEDSYNHFSLALLHLDVNRLWKVLCAPFKVYRIFTILLQFVLTTILSSSYLSKLCSSSLSKLVLQLLSLCAFRYSSTKILLSYAHFKPRPDFTSFLFSSILLNFSPLQQCYDLTLHVYI